MSAIHPDCCEPSGPPPEAAAFYRHVMEALARAGVPFLVGGAYAFCAYTGVERPTKDVDLFLRRSDFERAAQALAAEGIGAELTYPHWLGKAHGEGLFVDLIFSSGNGVSEVDDAWFTHAVPGTVLGVPVRFMPVEEIIWSKAFIMERERYDGADVAHLLRECAATMDWPRMLARVDAQWRVLLSHLVLFGFVYPAERDRVPPWVMHELLGRLTDELAQPAGGPRLCAGTLLSRAQYLHDVEREGYRDARLTDASSMTPGDVQTWTAAIPERGESPLAGG